MKKNVVILCLSSLFLVAGCASTGNSSDPAQQQQWQEKNIQSNINALNQAPQYRGKIRVTSEITSAGHILLLGQSVDEDNKQYIEGYVKNLPNVDKVYNQIRIAKPLSFQQISHDIWLTTKVKSALLSDDRLDKYSIKVTTENKEVFLIGNISEEGAQIAADVASKIEDVSKVIKAFNYVSSPSIESKPAPASNSNEPNPASSTLEEDKNTSKELDPLNDSNGTATPIIEDVGTPINETDVLSTQ
ncbi:BON domain-containing protein [Vibrio litoralis]|uniref:BON domain-containing protein n=1 Tax=Vibrio litoralis TaxID=335972 RepID=UPI00186674F6|nr:BON domain-containing protein [Vibrio litoralis]